MHNLLRSLAISTFAWVEPASNSEQMFGGTARADIGCMGNGRPAPDDAAAYLLLLSPLMLTLRAPARVGSVVQFF